MSRFSDGNFINDWIGAVNADPAFNVATEWFDGSVLLADDEVPLWLKIYNGKIIDWRPHMPPIGYTFKISAKREAWDELASGAMFTDLLMGGGRRYADISQLTGTPGLTPGAFAIEGDPMSAFRVIEAIYLLTDHYKSTASREGQFA